MTIHFVDQMWSQKSVGISTSDRKTFTLTQKDGYQVTTDPDTTGADILNDFRVPKAGQTLVGYPYVFVRSVVPTKKSPIFWVVSVESSGDIGPDGPSPLSKPPEITWDDVEADEEIDQDFDGNPIVTVNNEPIYGVTTKIADDVVVIKRNFALFSPYVRRAYRRAVNSDPFLGWPPGTAKMMKLTGRQVAGTEETEGYWEVTAQIQFREPYNTTPEKAWYARVRHEGFMVRETAGGEPVRAWDGNKEPVSTPVLLKADGTRETDPANAHWLEFKRYGSLPFNALGLV